MPGNQETRNAGLNHVFSELTRNEWSYSKLRRGKAELFVVEKNTSSYVIQIKTLSKENPVPYPDGIEVLDKIDYLVICNNLDGNPNILVLKPETAKKIIYKDSVNESAYWLQAADYQKHAIAFEQVFV